MNKISIIIKKGLAEVYSDGFISFAAHKSVLEKHKVTEGAEYSDSRLEELRRDCLFDHYMNRAVYLLSIKDYSESALRKKMGEDFQIAEQVARELKERGYIDDEKYANSRAKRLKEAKKSDSAIIFALRSEGVEPDTAQAAVDALNSSPEQEILELIRIKYAAKLESEDGAGKVASALMRRGYGYGDIKSALNKFENND